MAYLKLIADKLPANIVRIFANLWLPYLGAGIKVKKVATDYRHIEVELKLHWYNRNYVGTQFGGSIYAMTDPFYMLMLLKNLGKDYIVWDKAAYIDFRKPGRGTIKATFDFSESEIQAIKTETDKLEKYVFERPVDVVDEEGEVIATVMKTLYVSKKPSGSLSS